MGNRDQALTERHDDDWTASQRITGHQPLGMNLQAHETIHEVTVTRSALLKPGPSPQSRCW